MTSSNFILRDSAITVFGGRTDATSFQNISAGGQVAIGENNSATYTNQSGILYFNVPAAEGSGDGGGGPSSGAGPAPAPAGAPVGLLEKIIKKLFPCNLIGDLNKDCRVNIYDVSILFYGWGRQQRNKNFLASITATGQPSPDLNSDSRINIKDLSIMLYSWTG